MYDEGIVSPSKTWQFSNSDLLNWKNVNPSYREDPQKMEHFITSFFTTHNPNWADVQALLNILLINGRGKTGNSKNLWAQGMNLEIELYQEVRASLRTRLGLVLPAHLLHHPAAVRLLSGPIRAGSASTAASCQRCIPNARHGPCHPLVTEDCISPAGAEPVKLKQKDVFPVQEQSETDWTAAWMGVVYVVHHIVGVGEGEQKLLRAFTPMQPLPPRPLVPPLLAACSCRHGAIETCASSRTFRGMLDCRFQPDPCRPPDGDVVQIRPAGIGPKLAVRPFLKDVVVR
ncbi:hypothetical protein QTO34_003075 [Cnephaeus nilssonii]|uniref:Core shell protein Gag P30 domain-containing protein n=1 Tax=Cnephaeus nilssonii TaxID=3371016 RepID=A0AA40HTG2_CNENI|nr:hypothetical protein QTO34_003075 [Eptesicus nilssonii]